MAGMVSRTQAGTLDKCDSPSLLWLLMQVESLLFWSSLFSPTSIHEVQINKGPPKQDAETLPARLTLPKSPKGTPRRRQFRAL